MHKNYFTPIVRIILFANAILLLNACEKTSATPKPSPTQVVVNDYNILLVPDLSNRIDQTIHPKPIHDSILINNILDHLQDILKLQSRTTNVLDIYKLDFINRGILNENSVNAEDIEINFRNFKGNLIGSSEYVRKDLRKDIDNLLCI